MPGLQVPKISDRSPWSIPCPDPDAAKLRADHARAGDGEAKAGGKGSTVEEEDDAETSAHHLPETKEGHSAHEKGYPGGGPHALEAEGDREEGCHRASLRRVSDLRKNTPTHRRTLTLTHTIISHIR